MTQAAVVAAAESALRQSLRDIAREMSRTLSALDSKDGVLLKDQGRQLQALDAQVSELLSQRAVPSVLDTLRNNMSLLLDVTLQEHRALGPYRAEIGSDLSTVMLAQMAEVSNAIAVDGRDFIVQAITRAIATGLPITEIATPVADALEVTRSRAVTAVQRAIREFHETTLKRMGALQPDAFGYVYVGPPEDSPNIRPFCAARVGKVLTQEQADSLPPRERFNCRHSLAPIPLALALDEGFALFQE